MLAQVAFEKHSLGRFRKFDGWASGAPEVVESWRVVVSDLHGWKRVMLEMMGGGFGVEKIVSNFLMDEMKSFGGYPLAPTPPPTR